MLDERRAEIGSGVLVGRDADVLTLATAAHVVSAATRLRILDATRRAYYDVLDVRLFPPSDVALIRVRAQPQFRVEPVAIALASTGDRIWLWGHPRDTFWTSATGVVQSIDAQLPGESGGKILLSCDACAQGDSGSGVFTESGKLIGIVVGAWSKHGRVLFTEVEPLIPIAKYAR